MTNRRSPALTPDQYFQKEADEEAKLFEQGELQGTPHPLNDSAVRAFDAQLKKHHRNQHRRGG